MKSKMMSKIDEVVAAGPFKDSWDSLEGYKTPEWYQRAKFGIFIHWGVYSVPAFSNEWYPHRMYQKGSVEYEHHLATWGSPDKFGYKDFIPMFKGERFDPKAWTSLFKEAGARFIVPVAEHHDGFQMYKSALSRWNAFEMGPKRDIIAELAKSAREAGLVFGASSHRAEHYWFMGYGRDVPSDVQDPNYADFYGPAKRPPFGLGWEVDNYLTSSPDAAYLEDWLARTCELIDLHRPQLLWFDWWIMNLAFKPYLKKLAAYYYNRAAEWGIEVAINNKFDAFPAGTTVFDIERGQQGGVRSLFWQNDTSVSKNSWGYIRNQDYKEPGDIICDLVDIVSKNGALLLNVGPRADGSIPEEEQYILREIGKWLAVNGEAVYDSSHWKTYGEGPTKVVEGSFTDTNRNAFTSEDIRFTAKGETLYATVLKWPTCDKVLVKTLAPSLKLRERPIRSVELLGSKVKPGYKLEDRGLSVDLSACDPIKTAFVLKIE
jgi:alpha-L-fucosidase